MSTLLVSALIISLSSPSQAGYLLPDTTRQRATQSVQLQLSTTGPRLYYDHSLGKTRRTSLRFGAQYLAYMKPFDLKIDKSSSLTIRPDFMVNSTDLGLKWQVFPRRSLYLTGAITYNWHPNVGFVINTHNDLTFSGLTLKADDIGTVGLNIAWQPVMPYAGVGFGRISTQSRFGAGFELGVLYLGKPTVTLDSDGALDTTTIGDQLPAINRNLSGYRYLPSLTFTLAYQLNRPNRQRP